MEVLDGGGVAYSSLGDTLSQTASVLILTFAVVLVVCGRTRSVARELGELGSSSDWASVLL